MAYTRSVIRVSDQLLRFHGGRRPSSPSLLLRNSSVSEWFSRILGAGNHSLSGNPKSNSDCKQQSQESGIVLRSGMVLLKGFLSEQEQIKMLHKCENVRSGRFPGTYFSCLSWSWDPQKHKYGVTRRDDKSRPPFKMPHEFFAGVIRAINAAQSLTRTKLHPMMGPCSVRDIIPMMSPDLCILDYLSPGSGCCYPILLRNEDETYESLAKGLPIVEFSFGDSIDFHYSVCRVAGLGKKVVLESGDALVYGGLSRMIFNSVGSVHRGTAPQYWLDNSGVPPGRFSLSFSEF